MNVGLPTKTSSQNPKGKRLGFGYEKKSSESPSVQTARAAFLNTILQRKPDTITRLFNSAYPPFETLLKSKADLLASKYTLLESEIPTEDYVLRQPKFLRSRAIESIIPNWHSLQQLPDAAGLAQELELWGSTHNLRDPWCLNQAITFLREFESADNKNLALALCRSNVDGHFLRSAWTCAVNKSCNALRAQFQASSEFEQRGPYSFEFSYEGLRFTVSGPLFKSKADFKQEVQDMFRSVGGTNIRGAKKALMLQLREFEDEFQKTVNDMELEEPPIRWALDKHMTWLVEYQVPPCQPYRGIAGSDQNEKTVRDGVQDVAGLMGLTLRVSRAGRRRGVAENVIRRRALQQ